MSVPWHHLRKDGLTEWDHAMKGLAEGLGCVGDSDLARGAAALIAHPAAASRRRELTAEDVLQIVAEGERAYRRGKIRSIKSLRELAR